MVTRGSQTNAFFFTEPDFATPVVMDVDTALAVWLGGEDILGFAGDADSVIAMRGRAGIAERLASFSGAFGFPASAMVSSKKYFAGPQGQFAARRDRVAFVLIGTAVAGSCAIGLGSATRGFGGVADLSSRATRGRIVLAE